MKIIKTRLRSTTADRRLESMMILGCEGDIIIDFDKTIDRYAMKSTLYKKYLLPS